MIEKNQDFDNYSVYCDHCSHDDLIDEEIFTDVIQHMKKEGWRISKVKGEWDHKCPSCVEDAQAGGR